jgi:hypothetical protein
MSTQKKSFKNQYMNGVEDRYTLADLCKRLEDLSQA